MEKVPGRAGLSPCPNARGFDEYYQRIHCENLAWNDERVLRFYRELGTGSATKEQAQRLGDRPARTLQQLAELNHTCSIDFITDTLEDGRKLRALNVLDNYNQEPYAFRPIG